MILFKEKKEWKKKRIYDILRDKFCFLKIIDKKFWLKLEKKKRNFAMIKD